MTIGPPLERLTRRLAETPDEFLEADVATAALVHDLLGDLGHAVAAGELGRFSAGPWSDANRLQLVAITVWLLADGWLAEDVPAAADLFELLDATVIELAATSRAELFVRDGDRREELARTVLRVLGRLPEGETEAQAADRLSAVSAAERRRLLAASQAAEERARAVREALIRKAAEESADKYTRE